MLIQRNAKGEHVMKVQLNDYIALIREYNRIMNDEPEMKRLSLK